MILQERETESWVRHPSDIARLVFNLVLLALLFGLVAVAPSTAEAASSDLVKLMAEVPAGIRAFLAGTAQLLTVVLPVLMVGFGIWHRRFRELLLVAASAIVVWGAVVLIESQFDKAEPTETLQTVQFESWLTDASFPGVVYLAASTAAITAASPLLDRPWRRTGWIAVGSAVVVRMLTATQAPVSLLATVFVGAAAASLVLVILGAPARRPGSEQLSEAARRGGSHALGLPTRRGRRARRPIVPLPVRRRHVRRLEVCRRRRARRRSVVPTVACDRRVKGVEDTGTSVAPGAAVSHEAMATMLAANGGVAVPEVLGVSETERGAVLITASAPGRTLDSLAAGPDGDPDEITDEALAACWEQIGLLHERRLAHRQLDAHHFWVDGVDVTVDRFRWAEPAATDDLLAVDVADLLAATGALVGAERAVDVALVQRGTRHRRCRPSVPAASRGSQRRTSAPPTRSCWVSCTSW